MSLGSSRFLFNMIQKLVAAMIVTASPTTTLAQVTQSIAQAFAGSLVQATLTREATTASVLTRGNEIGQDRVALVIGNSNYQYLPKLRNPRSDAEDVCNALRELNFDVICQSDVPNRSQMKQFIRSFASKLSPQTLALFYFAGHGIQINGENFLLPLGLDAQMAADIEDEGLSLDYVLRILEESRSLPNIVILDACRDNPFVSRISGITKGLARVEPPAGTLLVYATAPDGVAIDGSGRNGLFTKHLLAEIQRPGRKLDELFQIVAHDVEQEARDAYNFIQTPYRSSSFSGGFCLAGCENPEIAKQIEHYKKEGEEAAKKLTALQNENATLRRQSEERNSYVSDLEKRVDRLSRDLSFTGNQESEALRSLEALKQELEQAHIAQRAATQLERRRVGTGGPKLSTFDRSQKNPSVRCET